MECGEPIFMPNCILAEGCVWNRNENALYFVDIEGYAVYRLSGREQNAEKIKTEAMPGCLVFHKEGGFVTAETNQLVWYKREGGDWKRQLLMTQKMPDYLRYNDGKCDCYGNFWVGTMAISQSHPRAKGGGALYCIKEEKIRARYDYYTIPNGMCWNRDHDTFYHIDTALGGIDSYEVLEDCKLTGRRRVITIPEEEGKPDGMCMDTDGNLWVAMWGKSRVNCYHPSTGEKLEEIKVKDRLVSCCCFGGEKENILFLTTARDSDGTGGNLYGYELPIKGLAAYEYGGI